MTHAKDFNGRFGIKIPDMAGQRKFIDRVNLKLELREYGFHTIEFLKWLTAEYGERLDVLFTDRYSDGRRYIKSGFSVAHIHKGDFVSCLKLLEYLYIYAKNLDSSLAKYIDDVVKDSLERSEVDLGVRWHNGKFYPSGAEVLDEKLVEDVLDWLNDYPAEKKDFNDATTALIGKRYNDAVKCCYTSLEGMARNVLKNKKTLDNNKDELLSFLNLSTEWGHIVAGYIAYANEYGKHASEKRHDVDPNEAETFLYMTGLIIRLAINKVREKKAR